MSNRLLIKSVVCANSQGLWQQEERDEEGNVTQEKRKLKDAPVTTKDTVYNVNLKTRTLTIDGQEYPIDDYSYSLRNRTQGLS